ncbi:hypothetical protein ACP4OV_016410 [Aristida adscensionis]
MAEGGVREAPPLTPAENAKFLSMLREARKRLGGTAPEEVTVEFHGVSVDAEVRRAPPEDAAKDTGSIIS